MDTFLELVAESLYKQFGENLNQVAVIFPNKRASLFFNEYLAKQANHPVWAPTYMSISELFQELSPLQIGDPIQLVCELYSVFKKNTESTETLDDFYFWGELLISDFDDVDKNLVDATKLFQNLKDLKELMDSASFLAPEEEQAIQDFFENFSIEKSTALKEKFMTLWNNLGSIYLHFKERLKTLGVAYEGMLYREVIESLDLDKLPFTHYAFIGFNVLNQVEKKLFKELHKENRALFYWDYDLYYTKQNKFHEAGEFIRRNLSQFPNQLGEEHFNNLSKPKTIHYVASSTESAQASIIPSWLPTVKKNRERENAIVLCNESLLLPVLQAIPPEVEHINITMGFPLVQTPIFTLISSLVRMQTDGARNHGDFYNYDVVTSVLKHPYLINTTPEATPLVDHLLANNIFYPKPTFLAKDDFLKEIFTPTLSSLELINYLIQTIEKIASNYRDSAEVQQDVYDQLYREAIFRSYTIANRFKDLIEEGTLDVKIDTLTKLLERVLASTSIPFHGEPAIGLQIMGVLETRNLDFKNLVLLSLNEGQLPKSEGDNSFIPYNLRKAFGMTTIEHKNSVYAYYFYRLIQRAEHITLLYNNSSSGLNRAEWSRFMLQLLIEWNHPIERFFLSAGQTPSASLELVIPKSKQVQEKLWRKFDSRQNPKTILSPSAINTYLDCKLKFFNRYIAEIKEPDEVSPEIDSALFGSIFHRAAELLYTHLTQRSKLITEAALENLLKNKRKLEDYVHIAFKELFFKVDKREEVQYNGTQLINRRVITSYLEQLIINDKSYTPFSLISMEEKIREEVTISNGSEVLTVNLGGFIDRKDLKDGVLRIIDYKTGGTPSSLNEINELFTPSKNRPGYIFQTFLYADIVSRKSDYHVAPSLLYIHRAASGTYSPIIEMGSRNKKVELSNFTIIRDEFRKRLLELLNEIFFEDVTYTQTEDLDKCNYCEYKRICRRQQAIMS